MKPVSIYPPGKSVFFFLFLLSGFAYKGQTQTALRQLESWSGRSIQSVHVPAPSQPSGNSGSYRLPFVKTEEQKAEEAREHYQKAQSAMNRRDWDEAVRLLRKAQRKVPWNTSYSSKLREAEAALDKEKQQNKAAQEQKKQNEELRKAEIERWKQKEAARQEAERKEQEAFKEKIKEAENAIRVFKTDIKTAQSRIKSLSKSLANNAGELERWSEEMDKSMNNIIANAVPWIGGMYIKYCFVDMMSPEVKPILFQKWSKLFGESSPELQKWLIAESKAANIDFNKLQDLADRISMGLDLGAHVQEVMKGEKEMVKADLETLLFLNGLLETCHITKYDNLIKKLAPFPKIVGDSKIIRMPGDYFELAKIIGETYTHLAVTGYSWYTIRKTSANSDDLYNQVQLLSAGIEQRKQEIECLEKCLKRYSQGCNENCTGKTRWSKPPPPFLFQNRNW